MKELLTLDIAFSDSELSKIQEILFNLKKEGIEDPEFLRKVKLHLNTLEAIFNLEKLESQRETIK